MLVSLPSSSTPHLQPLQDISDVSKQPLTPAGIKERLSVTLEIQKAVEQKTKQQSKCPLWYELRKCRITLSNFGIVAKRKSAFESLAKQLTCNKQLAHSHVPSLKWGVDHEGAAYQQYELQHKSHQVVHSGLWIDTERGWLASSPDGFIYNQNELVRILEMKCSYSARDMTPVQAAEKLPSFFCKVVNGNLSLKKNHNYYFQVQGQLVITHAKWCDFCVYTPHGFSVERITFDKSFWKSVVHKLDDLFQIYHPNPFKHTKYQRVVIMFNICTSADTRHLGVSLNEQ